MVRGVTVSWRFHCSMRLFSMQYRLCQLAKRSFYRAANGIFAKLGRLASDEVILELIMKKCIPVLLYGLEVCDLPKRIFSRLIFRLTVF